MTFKKEQIVYLKNGKKAKFIGELDGRFIVSPCFIYYIDGDEEEDFFGSEIVDEIFKKAPTHFYEAELIDIKDKIKMANAELKKIKDEISSEVQEAKKTRENLLKVFEENKALKHIEDFLAGKITHYVYKAWDGIKIIEKNNANCEWEPKKLKLLTLFGDSKGNLRWKLNDYSSPSSSYYTVIPCLSLEEAEKEALILFNKDIEEYKAGKLHDVDHIVKNAKRLNIELPNFIVEEYKNKKEAIAKREIQELQDKLDKVKNKHFLEAAG